MSRKNRKQRPFRQHRAALLRAGMLFDITEAAFMAEIYMPASITPTLWRTIAGDDEFQAQDPRAICLCWTVFLMLATRAYTRQRRNRWSRTIWFEGNILDRIVHVKAMAHFGDDFEPAMTLMTPEEACGFVQ